MAVHVTTEQILSCTVGQLDHDFSEEGIRFEELEEFCSYFKNNISNLKEKTYIQFEYPNGSKIYYSDHWRKHFKYFMEKYSFSCNELFYNRSKEIVSENIKLLIEDLIGEGIDRDEANSIVQNSIIQFLEYHNNLQYGKKSFPEQEKILLKTAIRY